MPLDYESIAEAGSLLGTGAIMVMDETDCVVEASEPDGAVLRARVVRQVHAVPRGELVGRRGSSAGSRTGTAAPRTSRVMPDMGTNILFRAFCALADGAASSSTRA